MLKHSMRLVVLLSALVVASCAGVGVSDELDAFDCDVRIISINNIGLLCPPDIAADINIKNGGNILISMNYYSVVIPGYYGLYEDLSGYEIVNVIGSFDYTDSVDGKAKMDAAYDYARAFNLHVLREGVGAPTDER